MRSDPSALPARIAHVTHALMARSRDNGGGIPVTTYEVCEYDAEAMTPASTYGALRRAMRAGLAGGCRGLWFPTNRAWEMRKALEERFLAEVDL